MNEDPRIERAVREIAQKMLERGQTVSQVVKALTAAAGWTVADAAPREQINAARQARREQMLAELTRLEEQGRGRSSVMLVAKKFARDPVEKENIARSLRRWRRDEKRTMSVCCPSKKLGLQNEHEARPQFRNPRTDDG